MTRPPATVAVDLGGTRLKAARLHDAAPDDLLVLEHGGDWCEALRNAVQRLDGDKVALCVPGLVDGCRVVSLPGKLPGIEQVDLTAAVGVPVPLVVNDAIAYGVGEAVRGAGAGRSRVVVVTLGTGIGVAVVEDGAPLGRGPLGGGVLGGQLVLGGGRGTDTSGRSGTFEAHCRADSLVASVPGSRDVAQAYALLAQADPVALHGFCDYRQWLVRGLTALALAHGPDAVVVGGGAAQPGLLDGVQEALDVGLWPGQVVEVRPAALGDGAALAGLGVLLQERQAAPA